MLIQAEIGVTPPAMVPRACTRTRHRAGWDHRSDTSLADL